MIISNIMLKSKNKATNSGCNSTKIFKTTRNATKYLLNLYMIQQKDNIVSEKMLIPRKKGHQKNMGKINNQLVGFKILALWRL